MEQKSIKQQLSMIGFNVAVDLITCTAAAALLSYLGSTVIPEMVNSLFGTGAVKITIDTSCFKHAFKFRYLFVLALSVRVFVYSFIRPPLK